MTCNLCTIPYSLYEAYNCRLKKSKALLNMQQECSYSPLGQNSKFKAFSEVINFTINFSANILPFQTLPYHSKRLNLRKDINSPHLFIH